MKVNKSLSKKSTTENPASKEDLRAVFKAIKTLMKEYEGPLVVRIDNESAYDLWSEKKITIEGRQRNEIYFAGLVIQSNYVGFYYMPVYADADLRKVFKPELLKTLKGKSCFHIKNADAEILLQISEALRIGFKMYRDRGWV